MYNKRMNRTRTITHPDGHTDVETYMKDADGVWIWAVTQCGLKQEKQAMKYATQKITITTREYLQRLAEKGYTVISPDVMTIQDVLMLYEQLDSLRDSLRDANEGAKLMHSVAMNGEQSVLSRLDNGVDAVDAQRWQDEGSKTINLNGYNATATASWRERHLNES